MAFSNDSPISEFNKTTLPLGISATFTGTFEDVTNFSVFNLIVFSDQNSTTNGLVFQWSSDGINVDREEKTDVLANKGRAFTLAHRGPYFRVLYTNDVIPQTVFRLKVIHRVTGTGIITKPLDGEVTGENFAQLVHGSILGKKTNNEYKQITSTLNNTKESLDVYPNTAILNGVHSRPSVTNSNSTILSANINRKYAIINNNSGQTIYIKFGVAAVSGEGVAILSGGSYEINANNLWVGDINAIKGGGGSSTIDVFEGS